MLHKHESMFLGWHCGNVAGFRVLRTPALTQRVHQHSRYSTHTCKQHTHAMAALSVSQCVSHTRAMLPRNFITAASTALYLIFQTTVLNSAPHMCICIFTHPPRINNKDNNLYWHVHKQSTCFSVFFIQIHSTIITGGGCRWVSPGKHQFFVCQFLQESQSPLCVCGRYWLLHFYLQSASLSILDEELKWGA